MPKEGETEIIEAVGIRTLGETDPGKMTSEQFSASQDLLFHGTPDKGMQVYPRI